MKECAVAKKLNKEVRIRSILDAARREFMDKGYDRASMESIAASAGLSKGGVYHHFGSKDEILEAINNDYMEPIVQAMQEALERPSSAECLRYYIETYLKYWMEHQSDIQIFLLYMTRAMNNPDMWAGIQEYYAQEVAFFEGVYSSGAERGELVPHDPKGMGIALTSALDGIIPYLLSAEDFSLDRVLEIFDQIFIRSVTPGAPRP